MNGHEMYSALNYFSMLEETGSLRGVSTVPSSAIN